MLLPIDLTESTSHFIGSVLIQLSELRQLVPAFAQWESPAWSDQQVLVSLCCLLDESRAALQMEQLRNSSMPIILRLRHLERTLELIDELLATMPGIDRVHHTRPRRECAELLLEIVETAEAAAELVASGFQRLLKLDPFSKEWNNIICDIEHALFVIEQGLRRCRRKFNH